MIPSRPAANQVSSLAGPSVEPKRFASATARRVPLFILAAGLIARLIPAWRYFLNPDEALHYLLASQSSFSMANKAALTNAHPPLLILLLYAWRGLGHSEFLLRLPLVLAGTAACWLLYLWLHLVVDRFTAQVALLLMSLAPTLVWISAEIRQYALLLFFMSACLYLGERAVRECSIASMILFSLSLYGALLTHYSAFLFACVIGVFMMARLWPFRPHIRLAAVWLAGQAVAVAIAVYYLVTHVARLRASGMIQGVGETFVRKSLFHSGEQNGLSFIAAQTLRFFTYLFSHGLVGTLALLTFLAGIGFLLRTRPAGIERPSHRELAILLVLPFVLDCGAALAGIYPYGGTRHCLFLAPFAVAGASIALARVASRRHWMNLVVIALALLLVNFFPAPPPMIRSRNQQRGLMLQAIDSLRRAAPSGSVVVTDYESGLLLGYYACGHGIVQEFPPFTAFNQSDCGPYMVMSARPELWKFYAQDMASAVAQLVTAYHVPPAQKIWLFDAGWITDSAPAIQSAWCSNPIRFGENIFFCELKSAQQLPPSGD